ncbi:ABC transporter ATP-binding protein [Actinotalea sp. M2MS4P-6]|uniref:ABC transporter ATP-binding protein n=1 Tax=Actinotalea sp. M2MS4P-6 TaxID=2983762 RepID=UPI0021E4949F|nr:ABC transporter ATP-binding protein [Actinotalea sp. M2MS4P-6]MCV2394656.1 ABC transporter ATP-binding protein [Actinotalea sp. M2MS4P-6]
MPVVEVERLHKQYGDLVAVEDVGFEVAAGEIFGILGPNGAGKTTTVECVAGLRRPDAGRIDVLGLDPRRDASALHEVVGVQQQQGALPRKLRVGEALELYAAFYRGPADPMALADQLGLAPRWDAYYGTLSGGQRQRLSIALALVGSPRLAILDELTTGLDPAARRDTWGLIEQVRDGGVTVLLVTHAMEEAERLCDRVALIDAGRIVAVGTPAELAERHGGATHLRFVLEPGAADEVVAALAEVTSVSRDRDVLTVTGTGDVVVAVVLALDRLGLRPRGLTVASGTLDDAFLALTGHAFHEAEEVGRR